MKHETLYNRDGMPVMCRCGFDPWEEFSTDNSGPDEDMVKNAFAHHYLSLNLEHLAAEVRR